MEAIGFFHVGAARYGGPGHDTAERALCKPPPRLEAVVADLHERHRL